jgi:hypothetical protein
MSYSDAKSSALNWSAKSAKYITAPDGSITGFSFSDGSGSSSAFTITADVFKIVASGQSVASRNPFTVNAVTGEISFNGVVDFTNTNASGTTTIDGSKITTNSISAGQIAVDAISSKTIIGGTINGTSISGVIISGAIIKASYIDLSSQSYLTNWKFVTDINSIPQQYWSNFALGTDGSPIVDAIGYYRLVTTVPMTIGLKSNSELPKLSSYAPQFYTYDYYQVLGNKPVSSSFTLLPYSDYNWSMLGYGKVWNSNNYQEQFGGKLSQSINIAGYEFRIDGYMERQHYSDSSYNTVFLKLYQDGSLLDFANATGSSTDEGIPYCGTQPYAASVERIVTIGTMQIRIRLIAANMMDCAATWANGVLATVGIPVPSDFNNTNHYNSYITYTVEVYTPFPSGAVCVPSPLYSGPMLSYTHNDFAFSGSYATNSYQPSMNIMHNNYKVDQA